VCKALGLLLVGYTARRLDYVSPAAGLGLSEFVGKLGVPCALLRGISTLPLFQSISGAAGGTVDWAVLGCGFAGKFALFWVAVVVGLAMRKPMATCAVYGLVCSLSNDAAIGLPILNATHPRVGNALVFLMTLPCCTILLPIGLAMCEISKKGGSGQGLVSVITTTFSRVVQQPMIACVAIALTWNYATGGTPFPRMFDQILEPIAMSLSVMALFSLGASLVGTSISLRSLATPALLVALKVFGNGFVCKRAATKLFGISADSSSYDMLTLYSSLPAAPIAWAIAREQNADAGTIGAAVVLGTILCGPAMVLENDTFRQEAGTALAPLLASLQNIVAPKIEL